MGRLCREDPALPLLPLEWGADCQPCSRLLLPVWKAESCVFRSAHIPSSLGSSPAAELVFLQP